MKDLGEIIELNTEQLRRLEEKFILKVDNELEPYRETMIKNYNSEFMFDNSFMIQNYKDWFNMVISSFNLFSAFYQVTDDLLVINVIIRYLFKKDFVMIAAILYNAYIKDRIDDITEHGFAVCLVNEFKFINLEEEIISIDDFYILLEDNGGDNNV